MNIFIGSDHAGYEVKGKIIIYLKNLGYNVSDLGTHSTESCDYPDFARVVASEVREGGEEARGVLICGTGIGMSIAANKIKGIRGALCITPYMAEMSRLHNNANILCLGARITDEKVIFEIIEKWLTTPYEGTRHKKRLDKIRDMEIN